MVLVIKVTNHGSYRYIASPSDITIINTTDSAVVAGHAVTQQYGKGNYCLFKDDFNDVLNRFKESDRYKEMNFAEYVYNTCDVRVSNK